MRRRHAPTEKSSSKSSRSRQQVRSIDRSTTATSEILLGEVVRAHGLRGAVVVRTDADPDRVFPAGCAVRVEGAGDVRHVTVVSCAPHRAGALLMLAGIDERDAALALVGARLVGSRADLPPAEPESFYTCDVIGLRALTPDGAVLGEVVDVLSTGANDVWVVRGQGGELLIPAVAHAVLEIDVADGRVVVDPRSADRSSE